MQIDSPGLYDMPSAAYHADPCPTPSLSASIAKIVWNKSPLHGWCAHPKNPKYAPSNESKFDLGSAAHAVLLEGDRGILEIIDAPDWRTKDAKEKRDAAHAAGKLPLLVHQANNVMRMVEAAKLFLADSELAGILDDGKAEQSAFALDEGVWIKGRFDWRTNDGGIIMDYKTTDASAEPESWIRRNLFALGYDIQAGMYTHLNQLICGEEAKFVFLVQETEYPYACSLVGAGPSLIESGRRKYDMVRQAWAECVESGVWPGYGKRTAWADAPAWALAEIETRELEFLVEVE